MQTKYLYYSLILLLSPYNLIYSLQQSSIDASMLSLVHSLQKEFAQAESTITLKTAVSVVSDWQTGYQMNVTLTNNSSSPTTAWSGQFNLPNSNETIGSLWNAQYTQAGTLVKFSNPSWEGGQIIQPSQSVTFGFVVNNSQAGQRTLLNLQANATINGTSVTVPATPVLNAITINSATPKNYTVSWNSVANATSYILQQSTTSNFANPTIVLQANALSKSFTNQANGTYYYRVSASNSAGSSQYSNVQSVTINTTETLTAPVLNSITVNSSTPRNYTVSWSSVSNATSYTLQQSTSSTFTSPTVVASGNVTSQTITNQSNGTYYYRVQASNSNATSAFSNIVSVTINVPTVTLDTPLLLLVNNPSAAKSYTINWNSVTNATTYKLEQSTSNTFTSPKTIYSGSSTSYKNTVTTSGQYYYRVTALAGSNTSSPSNVQCTLVN